MKGSNETTVTRLTGSLHNKEEKFAFGILSSLLNSRDQAMCASVSLLPGD